MSLITVMNNKLLVIFDPLSHYGIEEVPLTQLGDTLGFVPNFLMQAYEDKPMDVVTESIRIYGMGDLSTDPRITYTDDNKMQYPEDPDQYPIVLMSPLPKFLKARETDVKYTFMYPHGWVMFHKTDNTKHTIRMD